jgi:hypothetical protein
MINASEPVIVTISHRLGRDEAKRRLENGIAQIRTEVGQYVKSLDYSWDGYRLNFRTSALMQTVTGRIEVFEDSVRVELGLPRLLHLVAKRIAGRIEQSGMALLGPPKG